MKKNILSYLLIIVILALICSYLLIKYYTDKISPILMNYAHIKTKQLTTIIVEKSISKELEDLDTNNLLDITKNSQSKIELINFNTKEVNLFINEITTLIEENLQLLEHGKLSNIDTSLTILDKYKDDNLIYSIPLGSVSESPLLTNLGPKIPLKLNFVGNILSNFFTKLTPYGINNALLEVTLNVDVTMQIVMPFAIEEITTTINIPLTVQVISGEIPNYYYQSDLSYSNKEFTD